MGKTRHIKVGIIGATGYGGVGLTELLIRHPMVEIVALMAKQDINKPISEVYPHLKGFCDLPVLDVEDPRCSNNFDLVFYATPDGVGQRGAGKWIDKGVKIIDYSGDFRFNDTKSYEAYSGRIGGPKTHANPGILPLSVYGLPELHRSEIENSKLVGNPGCFAVACILGIAPALKYGLIQENTLIFDVKTGVSGAGKTPSPDFHFPARYETMNAYKLAGHQHVYEIERELSLLKKKEINITFIPHVIPMCRGIIATIYADLHLNTGMDMLKAAYETMYAEEPFIRVFTQGETLATSHVRESNFCNISINMDSRTGRLVVVSLIDNLVKGQAGNALQNMNAMMGIEETAGLMFPGNYP